MVSGMDMVLKFLGDSNGYRDGRSSKQHCQTWPHTKITLRDLPWFHWLASILFTPDFALWSGRAAPANSCKALGFIIFEFYTLVPLSQTFTRHRNELGTLLKMQVLGVYQRLGMEGKVESCTRGIKFPFLNGKKKESWKGATLLCEHTGSTCLYTKT